MACYAKTSSTAWRSETAMPRLRAGRTAHVRLLHEEIRVVNHFSSPGLRKVDRVRRQLHGANQTAHDVDHGWERGQAQWPLRNGPPVDEKVRALKLFVKQVGPLVEPCPHGQHLLREHSGDARSAR